MSAMPELSAFGNRASMIKFTAKTIGAGSLIEMPTGLPVLFVNLSPLGIGFTEKGVPSDFVLYEHCSCLLQNNSPGTRGMTHYVASKLLIIGVHIVPDVA